jgi:hypothetical protein
MNGKHHIKHKISKKKKKKNYTRHNTQKHKIIARTQHRRHRRNTNKQHKPFIMLNCSPEHKNKEYSCYSDPDLHKMRDMWNARHPDQPIRTTDPKQIWLHLKNYYLNVCNKETCWVHQMTKNGQLKKELLDAFAPESPSGWKINPNEWLSSIDILKVMNQYEKKYKCFDFLGPSPIDYDTHKLNGECVWEELCHFNLKHHIKQGHHKIGIIFNLDPHYKGGSHWVSLFINVRKQTIFYFDSAGEPAPSQIRKFAENVIKQGHNMSMQFKFDQNHPTEHQYGNTECGMYSLFFITHMIEDKITGHYLKTHVLKDKYVEKFRKIFYNENGTVTTHKG